MLLTYKFDTVKSVLEKDKKEDDGSEFVSAVCWRVLPDGVSFICEGNLIKMKTIKKKIYYL